jgi:hypothetical protein
MVGVCRHGVLAAQMPALEVTSRSAGAAKGVSRQMRMASPFLGNSVLPLKHHHSKSSACSVPVSVSASAAAGGSGSGIPDPEVYFYGSSALGQNAAGGKRVKWEIGSVAGAEKEAAASADAPVATWSHLGFNGGKRHDLKKILILGAGLFCWPSSVSNSFFFCISISQISTVFIKDQGFIVLK